MRNPGAGAERAKVKQEPRNRTQAAGRRKQGSLNTESAVGFSAQGSAPGGRIKRSEKGTGKMAAQPGLEPGTK